MSDVTSYFAALQALTQETAGIRPPGASPDEQVMAKIAAPGGGTWYVTNLGGIWTAGGAQVYGNYFGLDAAARNDPNRRFVNIEATPEGGYSLVSATGERYTFNPPGTPGGPPAPATPAVTPTTPATPVYTPPPTATSPNTTPPVTTIPSQGTNPTNPDGARAILTTYLDQWGLSSLTDQLWGAITGDMTPEQIVLEIRGTDVWKQRFAAVVARQQAGLPAISEADVIAYETQARQTMRAYGLPAGFYDQPDDFVTFLANDVSIGEMSQRVQIAAQLANNEPADVRAEAQRLYGITDGLYAAYVLDPDRALPIIQKQLEAAQAAGAAQRTGFGQLSQSDAERVASLTSSPEQAQQGFTRIASIGELRAGLPGEAGDTARLTDTELIDAAFAGDAGQQERLSRRQRAKLARFQESGQYIGSSTAGAIGVGTAR